MASRSHGDILELGSDAQQDGIVVEKAVEWKLFHSINRCQGTRLGETISIIARKRHMDEDGCWNYQGLQNQGIWADAMLLKEIPLPRQLHKLFVTLFPRCISNDPENKELASTALKLLIITRRPLSILELVWTVALDTAKHVTTIDALAKLVDHQRAMDLIHPFIARFDCSWPKEASGSTDTSVGEGVHNKRMTSKLCLQSPVLTETDKRLESLEAFILDACVRHLLLGDISSRDLFSEEQVGIEAYLQHWNSRGENVLDLASKLCNPEMFRLLISRFQEGIWGRWSRKHSPSADYHEFPSFAKLVWVGEILLLQSGTDWNRHSWDGPRNPLRAAERLGDLDVLPLDMYWQCGSTFGPGLWWRSPGEFERQRPWKRGKYVADFAIAMYTCQCSDGVGWMLDQTVILGIIILVKDYLSLGLLDRSAHSMRQYCLSKVNYWNSNLLLFTASYSTTVMNFC